MKKVRYRQIDPNLGAGDWKEKPLYKFVYDVPKILNLGFLPPQHILNQILEGGGGDAGMSPGASWVPFKIDDQLYNELSEVLSKLDQLTLVNECTYIYVKAKRAHEFDHIEDRWDWLDAVANKYREDFFREQEKNVHKIEKHT